jgi:hypothetical protein
MIGVSSPLFSLSNTLTPAQSSPDNIQAWQEQGWFTAKHLLAQVKDAIDIFEGHTNGYVQGIFLFNNAPSHQKHADSALSTHNIVKGVHFFKILQIITLIPLGSSAPKEGWTHNNCGVHMHDGTLPNGEPQSFYYPEDHDSMPGLFKGMEVIICECRLWPDAGLLTQCPSFKCPPGHMDCCCQHILFLQPDFIAQKSQLEELIKSFSHICNFYPKYHCDLNFIEQYWGAAKSHYHNSPQAKTGHEMEAAVQESLDSVSLLQIQR